MGRSSRPDKEGFYYFAKMADGWLYGPYSDRGTAAGVLTQMARYSSPRPTIWNRDLRAYVANPAYDPNNVGKVVKAKLGNFEDAPKLSLRDKYENAVAKLARLERMLAERGIAIEFTD